MIRTWYIRLKFGLLFGLFFLVALIDSEIDRWQKRRRR